MITFDFFKSTPDIEGVEITYQHSELFRIVDNDGIVEFYNLYWRKDKMYFVNPITYDVYDFDLKEIHPLDLVNLLSFEMSKQEIEKLVCVY